MIVLAACSTIPEGQRSTRDPKGPPAIDGSTVERHASQLDEEQPERPAGSQEELAASAYLVAHLADAGYVTRLDAVPVKDLVRSTNAVGLPPSGADPSALVTVGYDTAPGAGPAGAAVGFWLELARALRVVDPDHSIGFVGLGAENTPIEGGHLGSRRLVNLLRERGDTPEILVINEISPRGAYRAVDGDDVFTAAGFETTVVGGGARRVGTKLLEYLTTL